MRTIFCIYDKVCQLFRLPMFAPNTAAMIRDLGDEVRRGGDNNSLAAHPRDYCLHEMGVWDEETGLFELHSQTRFVCEVSALVEPDVVETGHEHGAQVVVPDHSHGQAGVTDSKLGLGASPRVVINPQVGMP